MLRERFTIGCAMLALSVLARSVAFAQGADEPEEDEPPQSGSKPQLRVGALPAAFVFEARMTHPAWFAADSIANLVTVEPEEGGTPAGRTVVRVLANAHDIVVGVRCDDADPSGIVSFSKARDSELDEEDHVQIVFDTFMDARSGYVFTVNPSGARFDGLVVQQGEEVNSDWDTIWEARTSRDDAGWSVVMRIPIQSLSFGRDLDRWGFNVQRRVQRIQETSRWSGASQDYEAIQTVVAGRLTGLPAFDLGLGLSVRPAVVGRVGKPEPGAEAETDGDISLDVTQKLGPNLLSALTVNTDFAETEVDARQVNLTRFELFFPEKRSFFLEGADIFQFGLGLDEDNLLPFFSRRIGLLGQDADEQTEIPVNVGGKINGRLGNTNLGALVVNTREQEEVALGDEREVTVPNTTMGVVRISQNILEQSSVGVLATFGDQQSTADPDEDRSDAWSAGVDFTYQTSSFPGEKNFLFGAWGLLNDRADLDGDKSAFGFRADYPNDLVDLNLSTVRIGDGFDPSLGFVPRNDVQIWDLGAELNPRPSWGFIRQTFYELAFTAFMDRDHSRWQSYEGVAKPLDWLLESGERFEATIEPQGDRPPEAFELSGSVDIPAGSYEWVRYGVAAQTARKRALNASVRWEFGDFYSGDLQTLEAGVEIRPSAFFGVELSAEHNSGSALALQDDDEEGELPLIQREFTEQVYGLRFQVNFSPDLQWSSFTQYDNESRELGTNNRLRWTFERVGDVFVVYNHNLRRRQANDRRDADWVFVSNEMPVKVQYAFRF